MKGYKYIDSTKMKELLRVYTELFEKKQEYCVICLRSAQERRMVGLKSLESFIMSINLPFYYRNDFQKICFVCERAAAAAHRFRLAVNLSGSVHNLFAMMRARNGLFIVEQMLGHTKATGVVRNVPEWENRISEVRDSSQLLRTEILIIDSLALPELSRPARPPAAGGDVPAPPKGSLGAPGEVTSDVLAEPEIYMESVVIDEEEHDPIEIKCEDSDITIEENSILPDLPQAISIIDGEKPLEIIGPNIVPLESLLESQTTSFLLHPIVEKEGVITVPSLAARIVNGKLVTMEDSNWMVKTPKVALHNGVNFNLLTDPKQVHSVLKNMNGTEISNIAIVSDNIPVNIMEDNVKQCMTVNKSQISNPSPMLELTSSGGQIIVNPKQPNFLLNSLSGYSSQQCYANLPSLMSDKLASEATRSIIIEAHDETNMADVKKRLSVSSDEGRRRIDAEAKRSKRDGDSVKKIAPQRETDWEDKIPMDVISFMDATDPNAPSALMPPPPPENPPLGIISDVQTISEVQIENADESQDKSHTLKANASRTCDKLPIVLVEDFQLSKRNSNLDSVKTQLLSKINQPENKKTKVFTPFGIKDTLTNNQTLKMNTLKANITQPISGNAQPTNGKTQSTSGNIQPISKQTQPISKQTQPMTGNTQPTSVHIRPISKKTQPVTGNTQPTSVHIRPISRKTQPISEKNQPISGKTQPISEKTQPANKSIQQVIRPSESFHQNVFSIAINSTTGKSPNKQTNKQANKREMQSEVIDLC